MHFGTYMGIYWILKFILFPLGFHIPFLSLIQLWDELMTNTPALAENKDIIKETIDTARSLTSINITMQLLSWDVFWGSLLAIPTGLMVMKKAKPENNGLSQS